ncbi:MAG: hypothetical protein K2W96_17095, partial [Gemmataceae bacterium]|nr:hypothetical protein [Gemmataceae bacterium]
MLCYTVAYRLRMGAFFAQALDFPGADAIAATVPEARAGILSVLRHAAERLLRRGEPLPVPVPDSGAPDAYLVER